MPTSTTAMWVTRKEPELRLVEGEIQREVVDGFCLREAVLTRVRPLDDLTSAERQEAEDRLLRAEGR